LNYVYFTLVVIDLDTSSSDDQLRRISMKKRGRQRVFLKKGRLVKAFILILVFSV
jgi:hypothetical protein